MLRLQGIGKRFPGVRALQDVSLDFEPGEIHAVVGENGAGKSTLIKIITGIERPDEGEIHFEGKRLRLRSYRDSLAMGIDALAQRAAVDAAREAQHPATVAVLGCGADVVYPKVNAALQADITTRGLILSEFAWGVPARAWRFPARNRVIAALAQAVVIVEGTNRSGARITADFALDLGREVLAVPGEAGKRLSAAPHSLLRQGACLCESADDVLAAIAPLGSDAAEVADYSLGRDAPTFPGSDRHAAATILRMLAAGPLSADDIALRCMIPAGAVSAALSELEVDGYVRVVAGGAYRLRAR